MKLVKWLGIGIAALLALVVLLSGFIYLKSGRMFSRQFPSYNDPLGSAIPSDSATIARGQHIATALTKCTDCHGLDLGGGVLVDNPAMGLWVAPNLTRGQGGIGSMASDTQLMDAIRHGISHQGRPLLLMPAEEYQYLAPEDVQAVVAYVRSVPPVDRELPPFKPGPVLRALLVTGKVPPLAVDQVDHARRPAPAPPAGPTKEYGWYIARVGGCIGCHGETLSGGPIPGGPPDWPPAANLTPAGLSQYDEAKFFTALRDGKKPSGVEIKAPMPVAWTKLMTDDETRAVWAYLQSVPPKEYGGR